MRHIAYLIALAPLAPLANAAVEDKEIATCAAQSNTVQRLECYDDLASRHSLAPSAKATTASGAGEWHTRTSTDPLTDKSVYTAVLLATSGKGRFGDPIGLMVRCADNKTEMYINWQSYLGLDRIRTTYRLGKDKAQTSNWTTSTDHKAAFFPGTPIPMLKRLIETDSFVANVTPYSESPVTAVFNTEGADAALADIRKGCKW